MDDNAFRVGIMQKINILCIGKIKEKFYRDAVEEYLKRLSRFATDASNILHTENEKYTL